MKNNKEILDEFGKLVGSQGFDSSYGNLLEILSGNSPNPMRKELIDLFGRFNNEEKDKIKNYVYELISGTQFDFLKIFEENEQFKIVYEENGKQVNLVEISEMLKAEPIIENGWIARFSKEINK
ncbi:hypothetical protein I2486_05910 [Cellulophaga sp. E16_2]|uniref:hypothetical protein n=1 Tax=unclassified Cellulophaga TaxID=2634405 RepID=UPI0013FD7FBF|nr:MULTISPECIES: hypothetical protein [unclassified Cellulophaga]MBO0590939.1 hypothetical protein [Cellulophaga sp. E16_2]